MARIIFFDGPDGVSKSTQLELLANHLRGQGKKVMTTRALGGDGKDYLQTAIRRLILDDRIPTRDVAGDEGLISWTAQRNLKDVYKFLRDNPEGIVLQDRGLLSHYAYGEAKLSTLQARVIHAELDQDYKALAGKFGAVTLLFIPDNLEWVHERIGDRGSRIEWLESKEMLEKVCRYFAETASIAKGSLGPGWKLERIVIKSQHSRENVFKTILERLGEINGPSGQTSSSQDLKKVG